ncbi:MAG: DUF4270 domain-containing protein [Bacteroidales bacterium]|nr:DUF4270 domain-containing protein [Bacteroidales bacterium]
MQKALEIMHIGSNRIIIGLILMTTVLLSCDKQPESIGLGLVAGEKYPVELDTTVDITAYSVRMDSVRSDNMARNLAGSYWDPVFGLTDAGFYAHARLSVNAPDFGESPQLDSVVLTLVYYGYYGNTETPQTFTIHELDGDIYRDSVYYSTETVPLMDQIGELTFIPHPEDSIYVDSVLQAPALRIPLAESFGEKILNAGSTNLADNTAFLAFFKGFCLSAQTVSAPNEGAILYFNLLSTSSKITIYYNDSLDFDLLINESCARIGHFTHDYSLSSDPVFVSQVLQNDTTLGTSRLYIQGTGGIKTLIFFPGLEEWAGSGRYAINQARLILPVEEAGIEHDPPPNLIVYRFEEGGTETYLDDQFEGEEYLGGELTETGNQYQFRISLYIQQLVNGEPDYGMSLNVSGPAIHANGAVLAGTGPELANRMKLRIIYTRLF